LVPLTNFPVSTNYTTNINGFAFTRSKTEEIDPNFLCGWENE